MPFIISLFSCKRKISDQVHRKEYADVSFERMENKFSCSSSVLKSDSDVNERDYGGMGRG